MKKVLVEKQFMLQSYESCVPYYDIPTCIMKQRYISLIFSVNEFWRDCWSGQNVFIHCYNIQLNDLNVFLDANYRIINCC